MSTHYHVRQQPLHVSVCPGVLPGYLPSSDSGKPRGSWPGKTQQYCHRPAPLSEIAALMFDSVLDAIVLPLGSCLPYTMLVSERTNRFGYFLVVVMGMDR